MIDSFYESGGQRFESFRARQYFQVLIYCFLRSLSEFFRPANARVTRCVEYIRNGGGPPRAWPLTVRLNWASYSCVTLSAVMAGLAKVAFDQKQRLTSNAATLQPSTVVEAASNARTDSKHYISMSIRCPGHRVDRDRVDDGCAWSACIRSLR